MKPTERFSNRAEDYRKHRPGYPVGVVDLIRTACTLQEGSPVADIGSGTGIFTRLLLEVGLEVSAVEPNDAMRKAAEEDLREFPRFHSIPAPAEKTGLPDASVEAITVAQAFHWFDHKAARAEFQRLLRHGGQVFIIRNQRQTDTSPFARDYEELLRSLGEPYAIVIHRDHGIAARSRQEFFPEGNLQLAQFDNPHTLDWPGLRGRYLSSSYAPAKGDARHEEYLRRLEEIFHRHAIDGHVTFEQVTEVYYGRL